MAKALDAGKSLADLILAKLPESLRESVKTAFAAPEATDALTLLGDSTLARADYSRQMDEIKQKEETLAEDYTKLNTWYASKKADLDELDKLKAGKKDDPVINPTKPAAPDFDPAKFISREDFTKTMFEQQRVAADYLGLQNVLTLKHYDDFKEVLDTRELLADKKLGTQKPDGGTYGLIDAYQAKFSEKLSTRDKLAEETRINKLVEDRLSEERKKSPTMAFPIKGAPSALDLLESGATFKPEDYTAQAAADEYQRLQASRAGS